MDHEKREKKSVMRKWKKKQNLLKSQMKKNLFSCAVKGRIVTSDFGLR